MSRTPAKPRAFSFKQQYINYLIQTRLLGEKTNTDSIFKKIRRIETIEDAIKEEFDPFIGKTDREILASLKSGLGKKAKSYKRLIVNQILGVKSKKIEELEKANITLKVITLEATGSLKESISFPAFDYKDLVTQVWYDEEGETMADFHLQLETKKFLFVVFQKQKNSTDIVLKKTMFWNFPMEDIGEAERVWQKTIDCINEGRYDELPKMKDSTVAHVRPHGKDKTDTIETPQHTQEMKKCFWLNAKYIQKML
jgi:DNA mismatch repair protein MutH